MEQLPPEQLREIRSSLESNDLSKLEEQISWLVERAEVPTSLALGMRLAVAMAAELRDRAPLGSRSGKMVAEWAADYPETTEEAIAVARQFLLRPEELTHELSHRLFEPPEEG